MLKIIITVLFVLILLGFVLSQHLKIYRYELWFKNLPTEFDGFKILHISDWHNRKFGKRILDLVNSSNADIVLVTGDCVQRNNAGTDTFLEFLSEIELDARVCVSFGNHELGLDRKIPELDFLNSYTKELSDRNVIVLDNSNVKFQKGNSVIYIYGLTVPLSCYSKLRKLKLLEKADINAMIGEKPNEFTVLMAHSPESFDGYSDWGADLCLSGHNHGGIFNIPFLGGLISASLKIFPEYDSGVFKKKNSTMVLNRGSGNNGLALRFMNNPEIGLITLKKEN